MRFHQLALLLLVCPAASVAKPLSGTLPPVRYVCEDGTRLRVTFSRPESLPGTALLEWLGTGKRLMLSQAPSADGGRYTKDDTELWDKGGTASLTQANKALTCRTKG